MTQQKSVTATNLSLVGAGGHAKVVLDTLLYMETEYIAVYDADENKVGVNIQGLSVKMLNSSITEPAFHIAIGSNRARRKLYRRYCQTADYINIISPLSYVARSSSLSHGIFVAANATISADSKIGLGCIINHGAIVEHDCQVGDFCHIAPNASLLGEVQLGDNVFVGAAATVLPGVKIANNVIIGAGAVVLSDIKEACTVVGSPARKVKNKP